MWTPAFRMGLLLSVAVMACGDDRSADSKPDTPDASLDASDWGTDAPPSTDGAHDVWTADAADVGEADQADTNQPDATTDSGSGCMVLSSLAEFRPAMNLIGGRSTGFVGFADPTLGESQNDLFWLETGSNPTLGVHTVHLPASAADCHSGAAACATLVLDLADDGSNPRGFFAATGTLELRLVTLPYYIDATLNLEFVEVTPANDEQGTYTLVPSGRCITATQLKVELQPPVQGWACAHESYNDGVGCDCRCGAVDPDCSAGKGLSSGCAFGQTCSADATTCVGKPTFWTCDAADYDAGAGNGCHCGCGIPDPDCDLGSETVVGCVGDEVCDEQAYCKPPAWTCGGVLYANARRGEDPICDCGCGIPDPDCADATVGSCDRCEGTGNCSIGLCSMFIDPTNNAICL